MTIIFTVGYNGRPRGEAMQLIYSNLQGLSLSQSVQQMSAVGN